MAIGIPGYRLPREVLQAEIARIVDLGVELRLDTAMGRDFTLGDLQREGFARDLPRDGRLQEPTARRPGRRCCVGSSRRRSSSSRSTSARRPGSPARWSSSAAAAPRWTRRARPCGAAPHRSPSRIAGGAPTCPPRPRRSRRPSARASRSGRPASDEVVVRDGAVVAVRCERPRAPDDAAAGRPRRAGRGLARSVDVPARTILVAIGEEPDPSILPEGAASRSAAGRGRRRPADDGHGPRRRSSPAATSCRGRRRSSMRWPPVAGPPRRSTGTSRASPTPRRRSSRPSGTRRRRSSGSASTCRRARAHAAAPGRGHPCRSRPRRPASPAEAHAEAGRLLPVRRRIRLPVRQRRGRPRTGRPARGHDAASHHRRPGRRSARDQGGVQMTRRTGIRLLRRRRGLRRGHDRGGARRPVDAVRRAAPGRPYMVRNTGKFTLRLGADLWWIIYVALRDMILLQVFLGSSSSSTRTSSPARTCRSPAGSPPSAPSPRS